MNDKQRLVVILGVSAIALTGLVPPWHHYVPSQYSFASDSYRPIFLPPSQGASVDIGRLLIEWVVIAVVAGAAYMIYKSRE